MTNITNVIMQRHSVRTYKNQVISQEILDKIRAYYLQLEEPYFKFSLIDLENDQGKELGDYGLIRGTNKYIVGAIKKAYVHRKDIALEFGYRFEKIILQATDLGLGTCWTGGTFKSEDFASAKDMTDAYQIVMVSPLGYEGNKRLFERGMRFAVKADKRKPFDQLFFQDTLENPIRGKSGDHFIEALEMVRLSPSAKNAQPWRIIKSKASYDFYMPASVENYEINGFPISYNDIGIASLHFEKTLEANGVFGTWFQDVSKGAENMVYVCSWRIRK